MSPWIARIGCLSFGFIVACGESGPACPAVPPEVVLGTGSDDFKALNDGDDLALEAGSQGGCHLPLAFLMRGLNPRRIDVAYKVTTLDNDQQVVDLRQLTRFDEDTDACQRPGFNAFVNSPWTLVDREIRIEISLSDEAGASAQTQRELTVRQAPPATPGGPDPCPAP